VSVAGTGTEGSEAQAELVERLVAQLAERDARLAERDERLAERDAKLAERDAKLAELEAQASALESERDRLVRAYELLKEELLLVKRRLFIAKAERVDTSQLELEFAELSRKLEELAGNVPPEDDDDERRAPRKRRPKGRRNLADADLPEVTVEVPDEQFEKLVAEGKAERIGFETSYKLGYERGGFRRIVMARVKYRAIGARGKSEIETAPLPPELLKRCMASPSTLARIVIQKLCDGLPLYRLEDILAREGFALDRGTMSRWLEDLGATFGATLICAMRDDALANAFCIATDATGFAVQPGAREGPRRPCRKGHYFVQIADRDHIFFEFTPKHTSRAVRALFKGFEGYVQADAANVYDALFRPSGDDDPDDDGCERREVGCWSHARRKYWEAAFAKEPVARVALLRIGKIFELDARLRGKRKRRPPSQIARLRREHLSPLVEEFLAFAEAEYAKVEGRRGSLRRALGYCVRQADALRAFLDDGRLRMDNNLSEGQLRKVVRIRDASLFAGSDEHAEAAGHLLSLIASARLHDLDPERYLRDLIRVLPVWPRERFLELAPKHWLATRARIDARQLEAELGPICVPDPDDAHPAQ
jgi:transposase